MNPCTYWYYPESDSFWIDDGTNPINQLGDDGMSVQLENEYEYVKRVIEQIDNDPNHQLPEGITAVIKNAMWWNADCLSGQIWYDKHNRFVNDYPVNTSEIVSREPGGIFKTKNHTYLVLLLKEESNNG